MSVIQKPQTGQKKREERLPSLWRNRDYLLLWSGQAISSVGSQVSQFALPLLILALTGSPAWMGIVGGLRMLPYLLLSLPAGALVDRWDRKKVMILCDSVRAICLGSIPVAFAFGWLTIAQICIVALVEGTFFVFFHVAQSACLPRVVPREQLSMAVSQNEATLNTSYALGPFFGGFLYSIGRTLPFLGDALSYVISVFSLCFIKNAFQEKRVATSRNLVKEIQEGLHWLWHHPLLRFIALLCCVGNFVDFGTVVLVIVLAARLHASSVAIGTIYTVAGIAGIIGAVCAGFIERKWHFGKTMIATQWMWAILLPLYLLAPGVIFLSCLTAVAFILGSIQTVLQGSYRLSLIPDELQGRVNSVFRLIAFVGQPLGSVVTGALVQVWGVNITLIIFSIGLLIVAVVTMANKKLYHATI